MRGRSGGKPIFRVGSFEEFIAQFTEEDGDVRVER